MTRLRIVVQHRETKYFCESEGTWTEKEEEAREFPNVLDAFEFASQGYLADVEILFRRKLPCSNQTRPAAVSFPNA